MEQKIDSDVQSMLLDDENLQQFVNHIHAAAKSKAKTVALDKIWSAFCATYVDIPSGRERRVWLRVVLDELDGSEEISLPVPHGKQWDRTSDVPLPTKLKLKTDQAFGGSADWKTFAWNRRLEWVAVRKYVAPAQVEFLYQVNRGMAEGWFLHQETLKYRSLQLTGNEKRLVKFSKTKLFGSDRITFEMLGCQMEMLPVAIERIGDGGKILMFENAAPFIAARRIAQELVRSAVPLQYDVIAYGAGKQVVKSAKYLQTLRPAVESVHYVGDLDAEGLEIASDLFRLSTNIAVEPATGFHIAMLDSAEALGHPKGWRTSTNQSKQPSKVASKFLNASVRGRCCDIIEAGNRIPEEALSCHQLAQLLTGEYRKAR